MEKELLKQDAKLLTILNSTVYDDLFFRPNLDSTGIVPQTGSLTQSPDIIPYGIMPVLDPKATFGTDDSYKKDSGKNLEFGRPNVIYLRAKNLKAGAQTGKISLYYAPCAVINWPSMWKNNKLKTDSGLDAIDVSASAINDIAVTNQAFTWIPSTPPAGSDHYCLISQMITPNHPNPIPHQDDMTIIDFAKLIQNNPAFGWRNVTLVNSEGAPTWTNQINLSQLDPGTQTLHIVIEVSGNLIGAEVQFTCGSSGANPSIYIDKTKIVNANQVLGITSNIDSGFNASINVSFWQNGIQIKDGDGLALKAYVETSGVKELHHISRNPDFYGLSNVDGITPTKVIALGSYGYKFIKKQ